MSRFQIGDVVRISKPLPDVNVVYHNKIGRIESISHREKYLIKIKFINLSYVTGAVGFKEIELEKLSEKEALAWLI